MTRAPARSASSTTGALALALALCVTAPARATVLPDWDLEELVAHGDYVAVGRVTNVETVVDERGALVTEARLEVEETLLGPARRVIVVSRRGGTRRGTTRVVSGLEGDAELTPGARVAVVLFPGDDGRWYVVGLALGAFVLDDEEPETLVQHIGVKLARADGTVVDAPGERRFALAALRAAVDARRGAAGPSAPAPKAAAPATVSAPPPATTEDAP